MDVLRRVVFILVSCGTGLWFFVPVATAQTPGGVQDSLLKLWLTPDNAFNYLKNPAKKGDSLLFIAPRKDGSNNDYGDTAKIVTKDGYPLLDYDSMKYNYGRPFVRFYDDALFFLDNTGNFRLNNYADSGMHIFLVGSIDTSLQGQALFSMGHYGKPLWDTIQSVSILSNRSGKSYLFSQEGEALDDSSISEKSVIELAKPYIAELSYHPHWIATYADLYSKSYSFAPSLVGQKTAEEVGEVVGGILGKAIASRLPRIGRRWVSNQGKELGKKIGKEIIITEADKHGLHYMRDKPKYFYIGADAEYDRLQSLGVPYPKRHNKATFAEIIVYDNTLDSTDRHKVVSYLALKYGRTLSEGKEKLIQGGQDNLILSDGKVVWDTTYNKNFRSGVAGVGRDNASGLYVQKSQSTTATVPMLTVKAETDITTVPDKSFLVWSHDTIAMDFIISRKASSDSMYARFRRQWRISKTTGDMGRFTLSLNALLLKYAHYSIFPFQSEGEWEKYKEKLRVWKNGNPLPIIPTFGGLSVGGKLMYETTINFAGVSLGDGDTVSFSLKLPNPYTDTLYCAIGYKDSLWNTVRPREPDSLAHRVAITSLKEKLKGRSPFAVENLPGGGDLPGGGNANDLLGGLGTLLKDDGGLSNLQTLGNLVNSTGILDIPYTLEEPLKYELNGSVVYHAEGDSFSLNTDEEKQLKFVGLDTARMVVLLPSFDKVDDSIPDTTCLIFYHKPFLSDSDTVPLCLKEQIVPHDSLRYNFRGQDIDTIEFIKLPQKQPHTNRNEDTLYLKFSKGAQHDTLLQSRRGLKTMDYWLWQRFKLSRGSQGDTTLYDTVRLTIVGDTLPPLIDNNSPNLKGDTAELFMENGQICVDTFFAKKWLTLRDSSHAVCPKYDSIDSFFFLYDEQVFLKGSDTLPDTVADLEIGLNALRIYIRDSNDNTFADTLYFLVRDTITTKIDSVRIKELDTLLKSQNPIPKMTLYISKADTLLEFVPYVNKAGCRLRDTFLSVDTLSRPYPQSYPSVIYKDIVEEKDTLRLAIDSYRIGIVVRDSNYIDSIDTFFVKLDIRPTFIFDTLNDTQAVKEGNTFIFHPSCDTQVLKTDSFFENLLVFPDDAKQETDTVWYFFPAQRSTKPIIDSGEIDSILPFGKTDMKIKLIYRRYGRLIYADSIENIKIHIRDSFPPEVIRRSPSDTLEVYLPKDHCDTLLQDTIKKWFGVECKATVWDTTWQWRGTTGKWYDDIADLKMGITTAPDTMIVRYKDSSYFYSKYKSTFTDTITEDTIFVWVKDTFPMKINSIQSGPSNTLTKKGDTLTFYTNKDTLLRFTFFTDRPSCRTQDTFYRIDTVPPTTTEIRSNKKIFKVDTLLRFNLGYYRINAYVKDSVTDSIASFPFYLRVLPRISFYLKDISQGRPSTTREDTLFFYPDSCSPFPIFSTQLFDSITSHPNALKNKTWMLNGSTVEYPPLFKWDTTETKIRVEDTEGYRDSFTFWVATIDTFPPRPKKRSPLVSDTIRIILSTEECDTFLYDTIRKFYELCQEFPYEIDTVFYERKGDDERVSYSIDLKTREFFKKEKPEKIRIDYKKMKEGKDFLNTDTFLYVWVLDTVPPEVERVPKTDTIAIYLQAGACDTLVEDTLSKAFKVKSSCWNYRGNDSVWNRSDYLVGAGKHKFTLTLRNPADTVRKIDTSIWIKVIDTTPPEVSMGKVPTVYTYCPDCETCKKRVDIEILEGLVQSENEQCPFNTAWQRDGESITELLVCGTTYMVGIFTDEHGNTKRIPFKLRVQRLSISDSIIDTLKVTISNIALEKQSLFKGGKLPKGLEEATFTIEKAPQHGTVEIVGEEIVYTPRGLSPLTDRLTVRTCIIEDGNEICTTKEIVVVVENEECDLWYTRLVTPNGDGVNDNLSVIYKTDCFGSVILSVYDKWGNLMFEKEYKEKTGRIEWNGTHFNGDKLPSGYYPIVIVGKGAGLKEIQGWIDINY